MNPYAKHCPDCRARLSLGYLLRVRRHTFECPACGSTLWSVDLRRSLMGIVLGSFFFSVPLALGARDHRWWWGLLPGLVLSVAVTVLFMRPQSCRTGGAGRH